MNKNKQLNEKPHQAINLILRKMIKTNGPIKFSNFMQTVLSDPEHGYYKRQNPIGAKGDFTTSAEISGLFGELCGAYLAYTYEVAGKPKNAQIVELGPGRGSLMADMQFVWKHTMPIMNDLAVNLVETSEALRSQQKDTIKGSYLNWYYDVKSLPQKPLFGLANEFFDALPVDQAIYRRGVWRHRLVGIVNNAFDFIDGPILNPKELRNWNIEKKIPDFPEDSIVENCPQAEIIIEQLASRIAKFGGAFLVIDYGKAGNYHDSLQAVSAHKPVKLFQDTGNADISHWVDFTALNNATIKMGARFIGPITQAKFLKAIGIKERVEKLAKKCDVYGRRELFAAFDRLVGVHQMGSVFKVALVLPKGKGIPDGFISRDS